MAEKLISITSLLRKSLVIYKKKFWVFLHLTLIDVASFLVFILIGLLFLLTGKNVYWLLISIVLFLSYIIIQAIIFLWVKVSMMYVIDERISETKLKYFLTKGWLVLSSYIWLSFLVGIVMFAGFVLFIIPGIIFTIWFSFSRFILIFEDKKGKLAMARSKELVKGYWWPVFGRFLLIGLFAGIVSAIPLLGKMIVFFFVVPYSMIYAYLIYEDLKRIKK